MEERSTWVSWGCLVAVSTCKIYREKKTELKQKQPNLGSHWLKTSKAARFTSQKAGQRENKVPRGNRAKEREKKVHTVYKSADPEWKGRFWFLYSPESLEHLYVT